MSCLALYSCVLLLLFCTFAYFDFRWLKIVRGCRNFCHRKVVDCEKCNKDIGNNNSFVSYVFLYHVCNMKYFFTTNLFKCSFFGQRIV